MSPGLRIAITGPESTGKSTLARQLSDLLEAACCPEYAREFLEAREGRYQRADLLEIAREQLKREQTLRASNPRYLIADTEMTVIKVWSEVVYGSIDAELQALFEGQHYDLYLLTHWDIPWEPDPLRENPRDRERLYARYVHVLEEANRAYVVLSGSEGDRLVQAIRAIKRLAGDRPLF